MHVNIACGSSYVRGNDWINLDYVSDGPDVIKANLLERLPFENASIDFIYCSHFFEHIPRASIHAFLLECNRILVNGGRIRFVMPNFEEMCQEYLKRREQGDNNKADFIVLEMLDQCVRTQPSGELGNYYERLRERVDEAEMAKYVFERTGEIINEQTDNAELGKKKIKSYIHSMRNKIINLYCKMVVKLLPTAFRLQNVSFASIGEKHVWIYDFHTVSNLLGNAGFKEQKKMSFDTSGITNFPFYPLDITEDGVARKGSESMYIEAVKA